MTFRSLVILAAMLFAAPLVHAQVEVADPWVRATVPGQKATGAFMKITSVSDVRLIRVRSTLAGRTEIHEMAMDGDQMKMRAVPWLPVLANAPLELKPGSYHVMLFDLESQIKEGDTVPLTLVFEHGSNAIPAIHGGVSETSVLGAEGAPEPYRGIPGLQAGVTQNRYAEVQTVEVDAQVRALATPGH